MTSIASRLCYPGVCIVLLILVASTALRANAREAGIGASVRTLRIVAFGDSTTTTDTA